MAKKFLVHLDVTYSGYVEVEASNEENAKMLVNNRVFEIHDIRDFYFLDKSIVDVEEVEG